MSTFEEYKKVSHQITPIMSIMGLFGIKYYYTGNTSYLMWFSFFLFLFFLKGKYKYLGILGIIGVVYALIKI